MKISFAIILLLSFTSYGQEDSTLYSFFVAGHTYGIPGVNNAGFHPPFKQKFAFLQSKPEIELGILTGDIVSPFPVEQDWDEIDADINTLGIPVYFAVGNHDMENRPLFESRYGDTYYNFTIHNDLFIVLDPNIDGWNISGNQLQFLINTLNNKASTMDNIYVFFHQVLWKEVDNQFSYISLNSDAGRASEINFWPEIIPLFHDLSNNVTVFAGDLGASWSTNVTYDKFDNITLIASGMGDPDGENFIIVNVDTDKSLNYELVCLSDTNINCLGMLTDHLVVSEIINSDAPFLYPNPATDFITIQMHEPTSNTVQLFNLQGELLLEETFYNKFKYTVNLGDTPQGMYFLKMFNSLDESTIKVQVN